LPEFDEKELQLKKKAKQNYINFLHHTANIQLNFERAASFATPEQAK
jgi:hypothetical protein